MTKLPKMLALAMTVVAVVTLTAGTAFASFYPADRPTYTCNGNICPGADHVVFNSFTNNPVVGDERPFFAGSIGGANVQDRMKVKNGDTIVLRAYVHNNADPNKIGVPAAIARNVKIKVLVPTAKQADSNMIAFISAANANPGTINDTMSIYGDAPFTIEYLKGSAKWQTNSGTVALNDTIVADGTYLGDMNGCFQYSGYVTLTVKVNMDTPPQPPQPPKPTPTPTPTPPAPTPTTPVIGSVIPNTGAEGIVALVAGPSGLAAAGHQLFMRRRK